MNKTICSLIFLFLFVATGNAQSGFVVNHINTDLSQIPDTWIEIAKQNLKIRYFRRSHGSQLDTGGMNALRSYSPQYKHKYAYSKTGGNGTLMLSVPSPWVSLDIENATWVQITRDYLNNPANANINVVMWAWSSHFYVCDPNKYVADMETLIGEYGPNGSRILSGARTVPVTFVFQTACGNYSIDKNKKIFDGNKIIRDHCAQHNRILFDFNDLESWDPDGNYYGDANPDGSYTNARMINDDLAYKSTSPGGSVWRGRRNWGIDWRNNNPTSELTKLSTNSNCISCAHSQGTFEGEVKDNAPLHCVLKGQAAWWLWARLAGWNPGSKSLQANSTLPLTESNLNGSIINLSLVGETFTNNSLLLSNFRLTGAPTTTSISSVSYIDNSHARIGLLYDGTNFSADISNLNITVSGAELSGASDLTSNNLFIDAYNESLLISTSPTMSESNLNNKQIDLLLTDEAFLNSSISASSIQLNNAPTGLSVSSVSTSDNRHAIVTLAFNGPDISADISNFNITISESELLGTKNLTSNNLNIIASSEILHIASKPALSEGNLNNKQLLVDLTNETFIDNSINRLNIKLNNAPVGLSVLSVSSADTRHAIVTLAFNGTNFNSNINNFNITILQSELSGSLDLTSNNLTITAYNGSVQISTSPAMSESNLNNKQINLEFIEESLVDKPISLSSIRLNNAPNGLSVHSVSSSDNRHASVILAFNNTNFNQDINNFNIYISEIELKGVVNLTSNNLVIKAVDETKAAAINNSKLGVDGNITNSGNGIDNKIDAIVYPNPGNGKFKLELKKGLNGTIYLQLIDSNAKIIDTKSLNPNQLIYEFDYQNLQKGLYHLIVENSGKQYVKTLVIE